MISYPCSSACSSREKDKMIHTHISLQNAKTSLKHTKKNQPKNKQTKKKPTSI